MVAAAACLSAALLLPLRAQAEPPQALAILLKQLQWRVQNSDSAKGQPSFYDAPFLPAKGIARSWVCTAPARGME